MGLGKSKEEQLQFTPSSTPRKILLVGASATGKSQILYTLKGKTETLAATIGTDMTNYEITEELSGRPGVSQKLMLFDTPGVERLRQTLTAHLPGSSVVAVYNPEVEGSLGAAQTLLEMAASAKCKYNHLVCNRRAGQEGDESEAKAVAKKFGVKWHCVDAKNTQSVKDIICAIGLEQ